MALDPRTVFFTNLAPDLTRGELFDLCRNYGYIKRAVIIMDSTTGASRGFGFVQFRDTEAAANAIGSLDGVRRYGRAIVAKVARTRSLMQTTGDNDKKENLSNKWGVVVNWLPWPREPASIMWDTVDDAGETENDA